MDEIILRKKDVEIIREALCFSYVYFDRDQRLKVRRILDKISCYEVRK